MSESTTTDRIDSNELWSHVRDSTEKDLITLPVSVTQGSIILQLGDIRGSTFILGLDANVRGQLCTGETYAIVAGLTSFAVGLGLSNNYVVCNHVEDISPATLSEESSRTGPGDSDLELTANENAPNRSTAFYTAKEVRKDSNGERVTGKNPFADPERLKETGIHQGGV